MIRVLHVHAAMEKGGTEAVIMNLYRNIDRQNILFEFTKFFNKEATYDQEILRLGGKFHYVKSRQEYGNLVHIKSLYKLFKEQQFDVVHTHMNFHGGIVALIAKICGVKNIICHAHSSSEDRINLKRMVEIKVLKMLIFLFSDYQIACSKSAAEFCFLKKSKYEILTNAVDLNKFYPNENKIESSKSDQLKIVHIGRFLAVKNHKGIIELAKIMKNRGLDFKLSLVGEGELFNEISDLINMNNLENDIEMLGVKDDINDILNQHDVCILPSLYEGLPLTLIEAQATGIPCVISKNITTEVDMGLGNIHFVDITDYDAWIDAILALRDVRVIDRVLIEKNFEKRGYSLSENVRKFTKIYNSAI